MEKNNDNDLENRFSERDKSETESDELGIRNDKNSVKLPTFRFIL